MNMQQLKIGYPPHGITKYYFYSFLQLLSIYTDIKPMGDHVIIESNNVISNYKEAFELALSRLKNYLERVQKEEASLGKKAKKKATPEIPASGNDSEIYNDLKEELGLSKESSFMDVFEAYIKRLDNISIDDLQKELYPFRGDKLRRGKFSKPSIFKVELYEYKRKPFFTSKDEGKLNLHQFLLLLAGYINARCFRARLTGNKQISVFLFPPSYNHIPYFIINKKSDLNEIISKMQDTPASLYPIEAVILWFVLKIGARTDIYLVGMKDPAGREPAATSIDIVLPINTFYIKTKEWIEEVKSNKVLSYEFDFLIKRALMYSFIRGGEEAAKRRKSKRGKSKEEQEDLMRSCEKAVEYIKLLFLACQKDRFSERLELAYRASREESLLLMTKDKNVKERISVARAARILGGRLLKVS